jgi:purine-binding chemotaxis protein CheW
MGNSTSFSHDKMFTTEQSWLISTLADGCYALPVSMAQTMVVCPEVTPIPHAPTFVRGVVNLRGQVMPVVDLRKRLGYVSLLEEVEEFCQTLEKREQEHKNWLSELEACIEEKREFKLATDPHKCAFGRWYDTYDAEDLSFSMLLKKFKEPHEKIHKIADIAMEKHHAGDDEGALEVINNTRNTDLAKMLFLFESIRKAIRESVREIIIVLEYNNIQVAVTVDKLESVEPLNPENIDSASIKHLPSSMPASQSLIVATGKRNSGQMTLILDVEQIFEAGKGVGETSGE